MDSVILSLGRYENMRDPKRIPRMCKKIERVWKEFPDQRLGQLLANYVFGHHRDIFFQEDDESEKFLDFLLSKPVLENE